MDKENKRIVTFLSIAAVLLLLLVLWMCGFDLSGFTIRKGISLMR
jgi:hypothetical protein